MAYYAKYKNTNYSVNLKSASSSAYPSDNADGRTCSTTQSTGSTRVATPFYAGGSQIYAAIASQFTQTISVTNGSYIKSWSVSRNTSPEEGAATGSIASGTTAGSTATVYLNDTLTATATAADTAYGSWNFTSLSAPTVTVRTNTSVTVKNNNAYACTLYWGTSSGATTYSTSIGASATINVTSNINAGTLYYFTVKATQSRSKTTYSVSKSWSTSTVSGDNTLTLTGSSSSGTENGSLIASSSTSFTTPYSITLTKNTNVSSISLTYVNNSGTSTTVTSGGTYYGKKGSSYSWSASAATGYDISSGSGSGTLNGNISISPTASAKAYTLSMSTIGSSYGTNLVMRGSSILSNGSTVYYGDVLSITQELNTSYLGSYKMSSSTISGGTTSITTYYQTTNSSRNGWTTTTSSSSSTGLLQCKTGTLTVTGNVTCNVTYEATSWTYHGFTTVKSSEIGKSSSTTFSPFGSTGVSRLNYYPTTSIKVNGDLHLSSTSSNFDGTILGGFNVSRSMKYAGLSRTNTLRNNSGSTTQPTSIQMKLESGSGGGSYKSYAQIWGVQVQE